MTYRHDLRLVHQRTLQITSFGVSNTDSEVDINIAADDLVEAFRELLTRMPNDLYGALKDAMSAVIVHKDLD